MIKTFIVTALLGYTSLIFSQEEVHSFSIGAGFETIAFRSILGPGLSISYGHKVHKRWWISSHLSYHQWNQFPRLKMRDLEIQENAINPFPKKLLNKKGFYDLGSTSDAQYFYTLSIGLEWDLIKSTHHYFAISPLIALNYFSYVWSGAYVGFFIQSDDFEFDDKKYWYTEQVELRTINYSYGLDISYRYFINKNLAIGISHSFYQFPLTALPQLQLFQLTLTKSFKNA